jgi:hypothetical protein
MHRLRRVQEILREGLCLPRQLKVRVTRLLILVFTPLKGAGVSLYQTSRASNATKKITLLSLISLLGI